MLKGWWGFVCYGSGALKGLLVQQGNAARRWAVVFQARQRAHLHHSSKIAAKHVLSAAQQK
jgi:hypothetical protein